MGLDSLIQTGRWGRFGQADAGYSHASSAHDNDSFPCKFPSARNSTIIDNSSLNPWQCYFLPLLPSLNTHSTLLWHGRILNILKFSMINGEFSVSFWMFKSVSQRTLLTQVWCFIIFSMKGNFVILTVLWVDGLYIIPLGIVTCHTKCASNICDHSASYFYSGVRDTSWQYLNIWDVII